MIGAVFLVALIVVIGYLAVREDKLTKLRHPELFQEPVNELEEFAVRIRQNYFRDTRCRLRRQQRQQQRQINQLVESLQKIEKLKT